jgi:signal transduction histidine kinase
LGKTGVDYLHRIRDAAARLDDLVRDVLGYANISRKALPLAEVELARVVSMASEELAQVIEQQKGVILLDKIGGNVIAHEGALRLVVSNLFSNALKFNKKGVAPRVRAWTESREGYVRFWVEDNGLGIATENQEIIFGVFQRLNNGAEYPGTGIGLAVVKSGIERMGGRVGLESELGIGSRFWFELPAATKAAHSGAEKDSAESVRGA